jgi:hypothetical protein
LIVSLGIPYISTSDFEFKTLSFFLSSKFDNAEVLLISVRAAQYLFWLVVNQQLAARSYAYILALWSIMVE